MKPAEYSDGYYTCPFKLVDKRPQEACKQKYHFGELVWHLQSMHPDSRLMAWIVAAIWEDVCSNQEPDCA